MTSTIERDFVVKNDVASFPMKEYPNYCGIEDIGYISHGEWSDAELEYKGKLKKEKTLDDIQLAFGRGLKGTFCNTAKQIEQIAEEIDKICIIANWEDAVAKYKI